MWRITSRSFLIGLAMASCSSSSDDQTAGRRTSESVWIVESGDGRGAFVSRSETNHLLSSDCGGLEIDGVMADGFLYPWRVDGHAPCLAEIEAYVPISVGGDDAVLTLIDPQVTEPLTTMTGQFVAPYSPQMSSGSNRDYIASIEVRDGEIIGETACVTFRVPYTRDGALLKTGRATYSESDCPKADSLMNYLAESTLLVVPTGGDLNLVDDRSQALRVWPVVDGVARTQTPFGTGEIAPIDLGETTTIHEQNAAPVTGDFFINTFEWNDEPAPNIADNPVTVTVGDKSVGYYDGCNWIGLDGYWNGATFLSIEESSTAVGCPDEVRYRAFTIVDSLTIEDIDGEWVLRSGGLRALLVPGVPATIKAPTSGTVPRGEYAGGEWPVSSGAAVLPAVIAGEDGSIGVTTPCRTFTLATTVGPLTIDGEPCEPTEPGATFDRWAEWFLSDPSLYVEASESEGQEWLAFVTDSQGFTISR